MPWPPPVQRPVFLIKRRNSGIADAATQAGLSAKPFFRQFKSICNSHQVICGRHPLSAFNI
jgi:hypothetical protein